MQNKMMKRCLAALVAVILVGGMTLGVSATVNAETYQDIFELYDSTGGADVPEGDVVEEYYTFGQDISATNNGTVGENVQGSILTTNNGTVTVNKG